MGSVGAAASATGFITGSFGFFSTGCDLSLAGRLQKLDTTLYSSSGSIGFPMWPRIPSARQRSCSSIMTSAVVATIGSVA